MEHLKRLLVGLFIVAMAIIIVWLLANLIKVALPLALILLAYFIGTILRESE
jgi:hypothetical protein